ncbi:MAG: menaquinone biosynthesis decarboxylase [Bacteroidetes bacterium]|nr:MAG: menaquinone biosynthesis decarboxylase [Bacteroidota bacterium]
MGRSKELGLRKHLERLEERGGVHEVPVAVSTHLEMAELAHRSLFGERAGQALVLRPEEEADFRVVMNLYSSRERMLEILRASSYEEVAQRIEKLMSEGRTPRPSLKLRLEGLRVLLEINRYLPKPQRGDVPAQEVVMQSPDLGRLPILQTWPYDGGAFITLPMVITRDPDTGVRNVGMYRMQVMDGQTTGMHWHTHKTGANHYRAYAKRGERMPVVVALGGDPLLAYCASAPLPEGMDEWLLAGFLRREPVRLAKAKTCDLDIPAEADIIIEGYVDPSEPLHTEGPFGDHTGFYSLEDEYPLFHVTCITHRKDALYPATVVGVPPMEDAYIAEGTEQIFKPLLQETLSPELKDLWLPPMGVAHNLAIASISHSYPGQGERIASLFWGAGQMMFTKYIVCVSEEISPRDVPSVLGAIATGVKERGHLLFSRGPMDVLDHAASSMGYGGKLLINAQGGTHKSGVQLNWRDHQEGTTLWVDSTPLLHVVRSDAPFTPDHHDRLLAKGRSLLGVVPLCLALVDHNAPIEDPGILLWIVLGSTSPDRDIIVKDHEHGISLLVDGRAKRPEQSGRPWPNVVCSQQTTINRVDEQWASYVLGRFVASPSLKVKGYEWGEGAHADFSN